MVFLFVFFYFFLYLLVAEWLWMFVCFLFSFVYRLFAVFVSCYFVTLSFLIFFYVFYLSLCVCVRYSVHPPRYVAIKFQKSARHYTEAAYDEIELLTVVRRRSLHPAWIVHMNDLRVSCLHV